LTTKTRDDPRVTKAKVAFDRARGEFQQVETDFLAVIEDLLSHSGARVQNLALMEGLREQLVTSLDARYRSAVNELAESILACLLTAGDGLGEQ
jgi:hypothetical protein